MIIFENICNESPYKIFEQKYNEAIEANQKTVEAISISSFCKKTNETHSRFVNLKFINDKEFIFFSNYNSPKSKEFISHNQITALIYWSSINFQIRLKAKIMQTTKDFNNNYFKLRDKSKNALAISSYQSVKISSYSEVKKNYEQSFKNSDLQKCPEYWGGYTFTPYYFEFWEGHESRLNKRDSYELDNDVWIHSTLQP